MTTAPPMTTTTRLPGAKAIVTGGARGIGAAIARRLVDEGAEVIILDLLADTGDACAASIGATFLPVDLADPVQTRAVVASAIEELGGVDVLVNSAGVFRLVSLLDLEPAERDRGMDTNARAMPVTQGWSPCGCRVLRTVRHTKRRSRGLHRSARGSAPRRTARSTASLSP